MGQMAHPLPSVVAESPGNPPPVCSFCSQSLGDFENLPLSKIVVNGNFDGREVDSEAIRPGLLSLKSAILPHAVPVSLME